MATVVTAGAICDQRYRLGPVLGRGPQGTACEATDIVTGAACCVKRLHGAVDEAAAREVCADAAAASALGHPGILAARATGFDEGGVLYLITDLLRDSLRDRLARGPLPPEEALRVVEQLCAVLGAAHDAGVHHGDLKPTNVFFDEGGRVLLGDFGMYRLLQRGLGGGASYSYLPPEYFREERKGPSAAGDVFALGALLYECLSGQRLFPAQNAGEAMLRICSAPLGPLAGIPQSHAGLQAVVAIACARDPAERFADAHAFSRAIVTALGGAGERGMRVTSPENRLPAPRSRPHLPGAAAAQAEQQREAGKEPAPRNPGPEGRSTALYLAPSLGLGSSPPPGAAPSSSSPSPSSLSRPAPASGPGGERVTSIWVPLPGRSSPAMQPAPPGPEPAPSAPEPAASAGSPPLMDLPPSEEATAQVRLDENASRATIELSAPPISAEDRRSRAVTRTMAAALGEITGRMRTSSSPRRAWRLGAGLAALLLVGAGAYVFSARPSLRALAAALGLAPMPGSAPGARIGPEEVRLAQRLRAARDRLAAQDHSGALAEIEEVLRRDPGHPTAQALQRQANEGLRAAALYDELVQAAERGDAEAAVALFRRIPAQSALHERGRQALAPVREKFEQAHLQLAGAALHSRLCGVVESEVQQILAVAADPSGGTMSGAAQEGQRLVSRCYGRRGHHKKPAPDMAGGEGEGEGEAAPEAQLAPLPY